MCVCVWGGGGGGGGEGGDNTREHSRAIRNLVILTSMLPHRTKFLSDANTNYSTFLHEGWQYEVIRNWFPFWQISFLGLATVFEKRWSAVYSSVSQQCFSLAMVPLLIRS